MQHQSCPRCKFRIVSNKRACATCGFKIPVADDTKASAIDSKSSERLSLWSKLVGFAAAGGEEPDPAQEKPALG